jgi:transcriptional regulator with XRE-family HTH domain
VSRVTEEQRLERHRRVGRVIRAARGELTQTRLGDALGPHVGAPVPQTTVSRWESGEVSLDLDTLRAIELALELPPGSLFIETGYVPASTTPRQIEAALRADPNVDETLRDSAVTSYRAWVRMTAELKKARKRRR